MSGLARTFKGLKAAGEELVGLLVDDWLLFFGTVAALAGAAAVADATSGTKTVAGLVLFAGIWIGLFLSLARAARLHRAKLTVPTEGSAENGGEQLPVDVGAGQQHTGHA